MEAGRLIERAAALGEGTAGLVISVATARPGWSTRRSPPAVALTPTTIATDFGVLELRGDDLVAGGAYPFTRT